MSPRHTGSKLGLRSQSRNGALALVLAGKGIEDAGRAAALLLRTRLTCFVQEKDFQACRHMRQDNMCGL